VGDWLIGLSELIRLNELIGRFKVYVYSFQVRRSKFDVLEEVSSRKVRESESPRVRESESLRVRVRRWGEVRLVLKKRKQSFVWVKNRKSGSHLNKKVAKSKGRFFCC
jgi:hypothetical protein